jgi:hypothetical protein
MLSIAAPSAALKVVTTSAANLAVYASYQDHGRSRSQRLSTSATISSATTTTFLSAPTAYASRTVDLFTIANTHASLSNTVTVQHYDGSTTTIMWSGTLAAGERLAIVDGFATVFNTAGIPKSAPVNSPNSTSVLVSPLFSTANLTGTRSITSTNTYAVYVGKAPRSLTSASVRYRVTTAAITVTWAEVALATGQINVGGNPTLTVKGYADVSGVVTATGQFTTSVPVSAGQSINEGDDLWVLVGNNASTVEVLRAQSIADDLQVGVAAWLSTRPSLNVGNAQTYTLDAATNLAPWVALVV